MSAPFEPFRRVTIAVAEPGMPDRGAADRSTADRSGDELIRYARMLAPIASPGVSFRFVHVMGRLVSTTHRAALDALTRAAARHLGSEVAWECHVRRGDRIEGPYLRQPESTSNHTGWKAAFEIGQFENVFGIWALGFCFCS